jgi:hypothetical protein
MPNSITVGLKQLSEKRMHWWQKQFKFVRVLVEYSMSTVKKLLLITLGFAFNNYDTVIVSTSLILKETVARLTLFLFLLLQLT